MRRYVSSLEWMSDRYTCSMKKLMVTAQIKVGPRGMGKEIQWSIFKGMFIAFSQFYRDDE